jgi:hypothetical protein
VAGTEARPTFKIKAVGRPSRAARRTLLKGSYSWALGPPITHEKSLAFYRGARGAPYIKHLEP